MLVLKLGRMSFVIRFSILFKERYSKQFKRSAFRQNSRTQLLFGMFLIKSPTNRSYTINPEFNDATLWCFQIGGDLWHSYIAIEDTFMLDKKCLQVGRLRLVQNQTISYKLISTPAVHCGRDTRRGTDRTVLKRPSVPATLASSSHPPLLFTECQNRSASSLVGKRIRRKNFIN